MERKYVCLNKNVYSSGQFKIAPIRNEDRHEIMKWRNEQMYHLRQAKKLTAEDQDRYFETVVSKLFYQDKPEQLLFSFFKNDTFIGYGGLVHINWIDKNAEISFIMNTEEDKVNFSENWTIFLKLIAKLAFKEINLHKIFAYAFDLRPHLYPVFENCLFKKDAVLRDHKLIDNKFVDVVIYSLLNSEV